MDETERLTCPMQSTGSSGIRTLSVQVQYCKTNMGETLSTRRERNRGELSAHFVLYRKTQRADEGKGAAGTRSRLKTAAPAA